MISKIKEFIIKYKHAALLSYFAFYLPCFMFLNTYSQTSENAIEVYCKLDDFIPFLEIFVIPYFLWFIYIAIGHIFLIFASPKEFVRMCIFLYTGMTICLAIYFLFPNYQDLRINYQSLGRSNIFIDAIKSVQALDDNYSVFPSIHCLNSIGMHIALVKSKKIVKCRKLIIWFSFILTVLIIMSTVCLKQHSILDFFGAAILSVPLYFLAYKPKLQKIKD